MMIAMSLLDAQLAAMIETAEGAATVLGRFAKMSGPDIDAPDVRAEIERQICACSKAVRQCVTHLVRMGESEIRACIGTGNDLLHTLQGLGRLQPKTDLADVVILEEVFCEERLKEMYENLRQVCEIGDMLECIMNEDDDPADWWKRS